MTELLASVGITRMVPHGLWRVRTLGHALEDIPPLIATREDRFVPLNEMKNPPSYYNPTSGLYLRVRLGTPAAAFHRSGILLLPEARIPTNQLSLLDRSQRHR